MPTIVSLGELMMRLKPPGKQRIRQASDFEICFGGAEANVAVSLAAFGATSRFITALPENELGELAMRHLRAFGVQTQEVVRCAQRMGVYYMEEGADLRSGCVIYDRNDTAFAGLSADMIDWDQAFDGADWFHISGITPAIAESCRDLSLAAVGEARKRNVFISIDLNHRARLWNYGNAPTEVMPGLVEQADLLIAGRGDCGACLGFSPDGGGETDEWYEALSGEALRRYPNLQGVAVTIRNSSSAERHHWKAHVRTNAVSLFSKAYDMQHVVDRVGTGDAFSAGLIFARHSGMDWGPALEFAAAANCLKHTIEGDANQVSAQEVMELSASDTHGRLRR